MFEKIHEPSCPCLRRCMSLAFVFTLGKQEIIYKDEHHLQSKNESYIYNFIFIKVDH